MTHDLLRRLLLHPEAAGELRLADWDRLLPLARRAGVLGRIRHRLAGGGLLPRVPEPVRPHLESAAVIAAEHERRVRWEVNRIRRALAELDCPIVLLKGAAYVLAGLACAGGRLTSDVDILVPREQLGAVEQALRRHGWETAKPDEYDQQYYRRWMHELPPLRHRLRQTVVDVHHTILPRTSRLRPDPARLLAAARPLDGGPLRVLAAPDMVLHSAAHTFYDGELNPFLRDLLDLHDLLTEFAAADAGFWPALAPRARQLDLERPLFYALRYARRFLDTPVPAAVLEALDAAAPAWPVRRLMDALAQRTLLAELPPSWSTAGAQRLLYWRSHWLRMPPLLLARHLLRKSFGRRGSDATGTNHTGRSRSTHR
ncbi:MAG: nucleotidyltransferase family protein [Pseudomonadota bacterium]|nr:nucleotidyltransferase family protein [Pseudomonadota bacterium]